MKVKRRMVQGGVAAVARACGRTPQHVSQVLAGKRQSKAVWAAAVDLGVATPTAKAKKEAVA